MCMSVLEEFREEGSEEKSIRKGVCVFVWVCEEESVCECVRRVKRREKGREEYKVEWCLCVCVC